MSNYPFFLESELGKTSASASYFHIISAPFEKTVSYGGGTKGGPEAIVEASSQLELFDGKSIPAEFGIYTHAPLDASLSTEAFLDAIRQKVSQLVDDAKFPVLLGGEHTVTFPAVQAISQKYGSVGIVQFDAHADLRNSYEGSRFSHACVMRRIHELDLPIFQIGTRSYSLEESKFRVEHEIPYFDAAADYSSCTLPDSFPEKVYITIDIDGLDGLLFPATGTPVPGGLNWQQLYSLLEHIVQTKTVVGFDIVEFAPIQAFHVYEFSVASLIYTILGMIQRKKERVL